MNLFHLLLSLWQTGKVLKGFGHKTHVQAGKMNQLYRGFSLFPLSFLSFILMLEKSYILSKC